MGSRDGFAGLHPLVNFAFFFVAIGFAMFLMHPICLGISLFCAVAYRVRLSASKMLKLWYLLPMAIFAGAMNPLFNHRGATILAYLPVGNPITLESVAYGFAAAGMIVTVIIWFSCFNDVVTSDKIVYLFGRVAPALSLILAMVLRLVPRFMAQAKVVAGAQKNIGRDITGGNLLHRAKCGLKILSILTTWALENSIETAHSMKGRGYGLPSRTAFSIFRLETRDVWALVYICICAAVVMAGAWSGLYHVSYFPTMEWGGTGAVVIFAAYFALLMFPMGASCFITKFNWGV